MNQITLRGCLAIALAMGIHSMCSAEDSVSTTTTTTAGSPVVLDSYMKPTVVRTEEKTDSDGNTQRTTAPLIQERHEHVMLPATQTTSTVMEHTGGTTAVKTESRVAQRTDRSVAKPRISHHARHHFYTARRQSTHVAQKVIVEKRIEPSSFERQDSTVTKSTVIERRDPALDQN
jgi:hypothetical protein